MKTPKPFVVDAAPTVRWPVSLKLPVDGGFADFQFHALLRVYSEEDYERLLPANPVEDTEKATLLKDVLAANARLLPPFVVGWDEVLGADGLPLPVSALPGLITGPYGKALSIGLYRAIGEVRYGLEPDTGATAGNSAPLPAAGSTADAVAEEPTI